MFAEERVWGPKPGHVRDRGPGSRASSAVPGAGPHKAGHRPCAQQLCTFRPHTRPAEAQPGGHFLPPRALPPAVALHVAGTVGSPGQQPPPVCSPQNSSARSRCSVTRKITQTQQRRSAVFSCKGIHAGGSCPLPQAVGPGALTTPGAPCPWILTLSSLQPPSAPRLSAWPARQAVPTTLLGPSSPHAVTLRR